MAPNQCQDLNPLHPTFMSQTPTVLPHWNGGNAFGKERIEGAISFQLLRKQIRAISGFSGVFRLFKMSRWERADDKGPEKDLSQVGQGLS